MKQKKMSEKKDKLKAQFLICNIWFIWVKIYFCQGCLIKYN